MGEITLLQRLHNRASNLTCAELTDVQPYEPFLTAPTYTCSVKESTSKGVRFWMVAQQDSSATLAQRDIDLAISALHLATELGIAVKSLHVYEGAVSLNGVLPECRYGCKKI